jgi:hypothetical protein
MLSNVGASTADPTASDLFARSLTQLLIAHLRNSLTAKFAFRNSRATAGHHAVPPHLPARGQICVEDLNPLSTFRPTPLLSVTRAQAVGAVTLQHSITSQFGRLYQIWHCECTKGNEEIWWHTILIRQPRRDWMTVNSFKENPCNTNRFV